VNWLDLVVLTLAAARLTRLVTLDGITAPIRRFIDYRWPGEDTTFADSEVQINGTDTLGNTIGYLHKTRVDVFKSGDAWYATKPRWAGNLISCPWCIGFWIAVAVWASYWFYDDIVIFAVPFAISEVIGHVRNE
jgi:hypothetical protein